MIHWLCMRSCRSAWLLVAGLAWSLVGGCRYGYESTSDSTSVTGEISGRAGVSGGAGPATDAAGAGGDAASGGSSSAGAGGNSSGGAGGSSTTPDASAAGGAGTGGGSGGDTGTGGGSGGDTGSGGSGGAGTGGSGGTGGGAVSEAGTGGAGVDPPFPPQPAIPPSCDAPAWNPASFATVYDVGPGKPYATPSDVPWESVGPGTLVRIYRRPTPYADKFVIAATGTATAPIVILGVPSGGLLPEITGANAVTRLALDYWSETRGIIKIGGSTVPAGTTAKHVVVECLDISGAVSPNQFTDDAGAITSYETNAAAIFVEAGDYVTIRNNRLHGCGNGLFVAQASSHLLVSGNQILGNGNVGSSTLHNSYVESLGAVYEFNRFGDLLAGSLGNNVKDRSSGLIVRYNWIEGGSRALDMVDSTYAPIWGAPDYQDGVVYGNVLVEKPVGNRQVVHFGGDNSPPSYRTGTLYFYDNTVVSERTDLATVVRLSSASATFDARNNIFFAQSGGSNLAVLEDAGTAILRGNWLPTGWLLGSPSLTGTVTSTAAKVGLDPGFTDVVARNYALTAGAGARGIAVPLSAAVAAYPVTMQYVAPASGTVRASATAGGAFE
jgi:hypothetical protein